LTEAVLLPCIGSLILLTIANPSVSAKDPAVDEQLRRVQLEVVDLRARWRAEEQARGMLEQAIRRELDSVNARGTSAVAAFEAIIQFVTLLTAIGGVVLALLGYLGVRFLLPRHLSKLFEEVIRKESEQQITRHLGEWDRRFADKMTEINKAKEEFFGGRR
jgi:hypothetical protein